MNWSSVTGPFSISTLGIIISRKDGLEGGMGIIRKH